MHVGEIKTSDIANGVGVRVSVFVSGCTNCCKGCFQPQTWNFDFGELYTKDMEDSIVEELRKPYYKGLTILGGEPFEIQNQPEVWQLIDRVKRELPAIDIWMYTGFTYDVDLVPGGRRFCDVTDLILNHIDVLVDGRYEEELASIMLNFRGSKNQRIIDMKETRKQKNVILSPLNN